ncbi:MAG: hypothetical protein ACFFDF_06580 [Candidatus Odinarchaeota archaeon]
MKFSKIDLGRQTNFIIALLLIHFIFFGYISNVFFKNLGINILYLHRVLFHPYSFLSFIILFGIVFLMVFRENFFEYGIRNSIWLVVFIIIESWFWYFFVFYNLQTNIFILLGNTFIAIGQFFISIEGYITLITLFATNLLAAILASIAKEKYNLRIKKGIKIEV